jgi:hypothetical protein
VADDSLTPKDFGYSQEWLDKHPQVRKKVNQAIKNNWGQTRLETEIRDTDWYRKLDRDKKRWSTITVEEPAQAARMKSEAKQQLRQYARLMGVSVTNKELNRWALQAAKHGWDETDMRQAIATTINKKDFREGTGDIDTANRQVDQWVNNYLVRVSSDQRLEWAKSIARGDMDPSDIETYFQRQAQRLYGGIADDIRAGATTAEVMSPYLEDAARELGVTAGAINMFEPKWTAALTGGDGGRALTREEWQRKIRTEDRYGYKKTRKAKNEAASMVNGILGIFGQR